MGTLQPAGSSEKQYLPDGDFQTDSCVKPQAQSPINTNAPEDAEGRTYSACATKVGKAMAADSP